MEEPRKVDYYAENLDKLVALQAYFETLTHAHAARMLLYRSASEVEFAVYESSGLREDDAASAKILDIYKDYAEASLRNALVLLAARMRGSQIRDEIEAEPLPFEHAVWRTSFLGGNANTVSVLEVHGIEGFQPEVLRHYALSVEEQTGMLTLQMAFAGNKPVHAWANMTIPDAMGKAVARQCYELFGMQSKVIELLAGKAVSEEELDVSLAAIAASVKGVYPDEAVQPLLGMVREYALRRKTASTVGLPSPEVLSDIEEFFRGIQAAEDHDNNS